MFILVENNSNLILPHLNKYLLLKFYRAIVAPQRDKKQKYDPYLIEQQMFVASREWF